MPPTKQIQRAGGASDATRIANMPAPVGQGQIFAERASVGLMSSNDEVERRGGASTPNEADLSRSSTLSLAYRSCAPRSLQLLRWTPPGMAVRHQCAKLSMCGVSAKTEPKGVRYECYDRCRRLGKKYLRNCRRRCRLARCTAQQATSR